MRGGEARAANTPTPCRQARSVRRHSSRASGIGQQPAGTATDGDTGWQGGGVAGMMRARHEAESKAADAALVARLATATTGDGDRIPRAREVGQSAGLSSRPGRHNGAGSSQTEPVEGCVEGLVLLVELLEAARESRAEASLRLPCTFSEPSCRRATFRRRTGPSARATRSRRSSSVRTLSAPTRCTTRRSRSGAALGSCGAARAAAAARTYSAVSTPRRPSSPSASARSGATAARTRSASPRWTRAVCCSAACATCGCR